MTALRASVVIPSYRRPTDLARCLEALEGQSAMPHEVLVGVRRDDAMTQRVLDDFASRSLPIVAVSVGTDNASAARNRCIARASGDIVAMIDDDTAPHPAWLATIVARFADDASLGGVGGPDWFRGEIVPASARPTVVGKVQWWGRRVGNHHLGATRAVTVEWLKGANMSFRRDLLGHIPFGQGLRGGGAQFAEDVAFSLRIRREGHTLLYDPAVAVDHFPGVLTAGVDHRRLADKASLADAAHNETVAMLDYLSAPRRQVFLAWALLVGTQLLPGLAIAVYLTLRGERSAFERCRTIWRGRRDGLRTWKSSSHRRRTATRSTRICLVTHVVTRLDGQGRVNYELAKYLARRGHAVTLVTSAVDPELQREPGVSWIRVPMPNRIPSLLRWGLFALVARLRLGRRSDKRFDIVHLNGAIAPVHAHVNTSHFVHAGWRRAAPRGARRARLKALYQRMVTGVGTFSERRAYRTAGRVVAVSEVVRQSLSTDVGVPESAIELIHTGVDSQEFRPRAAGEAQALRGPLSLPAGAIVMLFVGDAKSTRKNLDLPLQTLARLGPEYHLVVVGDAKGGPYADMAASLGVATRTHFVGARKDVASCYRDADVIICAAHYEPASLVLFEAMASAVPVIATPEVGNAAFVVDRSNGYLLRSGTDVAGAVEIVNLLGRDAALRRRIGEAARETVTALSWERMGRRYEALYLDITQRFTPASDEVLA